MDIVLFDVEPPKYLVLQNVVKCSKLMPPAFCDRAINSAARTSSQEAVSPYI
jgi:hypothetical protein